MPYEAVFSCTGIFMLLFFLGSINVIDIVFDNAGINAPLFSN